LKRTFSVKGEHQFNTVKLSAERPAVIMVYETGGSA